MAATSALKVIPWCGKGNKLNVNDKDFHILKPGFNWAFTFDFQQCGILTSVDSDKYVQPPFKLRNFKWCLVNSLTVTEYSSH